jgi:hypothetical protein
MTSNVWQTMSLPTSASLRKLVTTLDEFATYITNNVDIVNYGERFRAGDCISTGFVESAVNQIVDKRFNKRQSMRWAHRGAHHRFGVLPGARPGVAGADGADARAVIDALLLVLAAHAKELENAGKISLDLVPCAVAANDHVLRHALLRAEARSVAA